MNQNARLAVQEALQDLGYYQGPIDGVLGGATRQAIASYQRASGEPATGVLTPGQLRRLTADKPSADEGGATRVGPGNRLQPEEPLANDSVAKGAVQSQVPARSGERAAQVPGDAANLSRQLGLPALNGRIQLLQGSHPPQTILRFENFFKLLSLSNNPALIENPTFTHQFLSLLAPNERSRYYGPRIFTGPSGLTSHGEPTWLGRDQFEQEDARRRFLDENRDRILSLVPRLPLQVVLVKEIPVGQYDQQSQSFQIGDPRRPGSRIELWPSIPGPIDTIVGTLTGTGNVQINEPMTLPNTLKMPEASARQLLTRIRQSGPLRVVINFEFETVRSSRGRDLEIITNLVDYKFFVGNQEIEHERPTDTPVAEESNGGRSVQANLPPPEVPRRASGTFDILGMRLGQDVEEALAIIKTEFGDYQVAHRDGDLNDPGVPRFRQVDIAKDGVLEERIFLGFHPEDRKLVVVKRSAPPVPSNLGPESYEDLIRKKYGNADHLMFSTSGVWAVDRAIKPKLRDNNRCYATIGNTFEHSSFRTDFVSQQCGEIFQTYFFAGRGYGYLLFDSNSIVERRIKNPVKAPPPEQPSGTRSKI